MTFEVDPSKWQDTCYIVAGGPSLKGFNWNQLRGNFVIAINRAYEVLPDAQVVYFTDAPFWTTHKKDMLNHKGQLIRGAINPEKEEHHERIEFYELTGNQKLETKPGCLKHGSNSTYAATNLAAVHFGFTRIYLLGVDMKWDDGATHWHDGHKRIDAESTYINMIKNWATIADPLKDMGVEVYNASPDSALDCFPKIKLPQAVAHLPRKRYNKPT